MVVESNLIIYPVFISKNKINNFNYLTKKNFMKKVFQTKLKNITKVLALVIVASFATFTGCKSYDADISKLNTDIATLTKQVTDLNTATNAALSAQITALTTQLTADEAKLTALQTSSTATATQITALQNSITSQAATIAALQAYQVTATAQITALQASVAASAKQTDLTALQATVNSFITSTTTTLNSLGVRITTVEGTIATMNGTLTTAQTDIATLKGRVDAQLATITGLQTTVAALQTTATGNTTAITALQTAMTSQGTSITSIQTSLAAQLVTLTAHAASITQLQTNLLALQTSVTALQTSVNKNTTDIAANTLAIAALQTSFTQTTANFKALATAVNLNLAALSSRLTSLVFIPTLHVSGISSMNFSTITYNSCATPSLPIIITPKYRVSYHVNPSFIAEADIDKNNLGFVVTKSVNIVTTYFAAPAVADARINATFVDLTNGILTVDVLVTDFNSLLGISGGNTTTNAITMTGTTTGTSTLTEKFSMVALQVPLSDKAVKDNNITFDDVSQTVIVGAATYPTSRVVTSDYARLYYVNMNAPTDVYLVKILNPVTSSPKLSSSVADAEALAVIGVNNGNGAATATDPLVITLPYGKSINLKDSIGAYSIAISDLIAFERYGLSFTFDLNDANGNAIVYNRGGNTTDQQQFIQITDPAAGTINAKVFTQSQIDAAQGRTPIVRVRVFNINNATCPVFTAWVKVLIADKPSLTPVTIPFIFGPNADPGCDDVVGRISVQQMNELIYNRIGMSKTAFYATYTTFTPSGEYSSLVQVPDAQQTDSYVINWTLTSSYIWSKLYTAPNGTYTFTAKVTYKSLVPSVNPDVVITFTRTITRSTLNIPAASLITNYWYNNFANVKHNIVVPFVGETTTVGANSIANNINQAFEQNANFSLKIMGSNNYNYFFTTSQPAIPNGSLTNPTTTTLVPSVDGQTLHVGSANGELVATINTFASGTGDVLVLNQSSGIAMKLLNVSSENLKARIGIKTVWCNTLTQYVRPVTINGSNYFDVVFVRPISPQPATGQYFVDALNLGDKHTYLEIAKLTNLNDWRFSDPVASFNGDSIATPIIPAHLNYYSYYGVTNITADVANIRTDLNQAAGVTVPLAQYPDLKVFNANNVVGVTNPTTPPPFFGYLTYQNTGNTLGKLFNLYVPVTITYAWGQIVSAQAIVPVWKTVGQSGVKRK